MQPATPSLVLASSKSTPYAGEIVDITLTLQGAGWKSSSAPVVSLPWLKSITGWQMSADQWASQMAQATPEALPLRWQEKTIYARLIKPHTWQLSWQLLVSAPNENEGTPLTLGGAKVGTVASNSVSLEVQRPPAMIASTSYWDLGVGSFRVTARWLQDRVALGEEAKLEWTVEGKGNLAAINPPLLRQFPGWEGDRFSLEWSNSSIQAQQRRFIFLVRPRQLQVKFSPITVRFFDPDRGIVVTQQVLIPPLQCTSSAAISLQPGSSVQDARKHLPEEHRYAVELNEQSNIRYLPYLHWLLWLPVLAALLFIGRMAMERWLPHQVLKWRWQQAVSRSQQVWARSTSSPAVLREVLAGLLRSRLDRTVTADYAGLRQAAIAAELQQPLSALLLLTEEWEFGPDNSSRSEMVQRQARLFFTEARKL